MQSLRYLALGDSYTIGEGVAEHERWPEQWCAALRKADVAVDARIIARTGWTTDELWAAMDAAEPLGQFDFASLLIGVNNQYRGRSADIYRTEFAALIERTIGLVGDRPEQVIVLAIPDWGVTPFARASGRDAVQIARELDAYNEIARDICSLEGANFLDISPLVRENGGDTDMLADDGLHPSGAMYARWVELLLDTMP
ncbi:SGNH/GDSL hydrolase family protein [Arenimonas oryziterrae]|uniref:SGNH hydrolase-type esterase domain-containing protein n=1 Tax=Arenimonas oryziterrae DSM 21050 = YC6267 TaxID=1121015 RepID=A0A091ATB8_9GAMM|nr:SGNH/GDSL hydrolase family protein [Arenimonas oryziterrae]KFN42611.1 hypothetical protein N789_13300 [Arenimonas oryziterrae DSM 21050 = YC6267]